MVFHMHPNSCSKQLTVIKRLSKILPLLAIIMFTSIITKANPDGYQIKTVVIDAGHGGKDPGAIGKHSYEKNIVLGIATKLGNYISKYMPNVKVIYTRNSDTFIALDKRSEIANKNDADLFISIHANANNNHKIYGTETYTLGLHKTKENLEVAMKENAVMLYEEDYSTKYEGFDPNNPASYIIFNLLQGINREKSIDLAELTEFQFKNRAGRHSRGVREAGFWVLKQVSMPSILVEAGFISNPTEEKYLNSKQGQEYLASAIFRAFRDYKKKVENKSSIITRRVEPAPKAEPQKDTIAQKESISNELIFCVQIRSSKKKIPLTDKFFKDMGEVTERKINGIFKYTVGKTSQYSQITKKQRSIKKRVKDCFIVAFHKGQPISISKARKLKRKSLKI